MDAHKLRAAIYTSLASTPAFDLTPFRTIAPMLTSFGDFTRLGILTPFLPSAAHDTLAVADLAFRARIVLPQIGCTFMEYDGVFRITFSSGRRHTTEAKMAEFEAALRGWIDVMLQ